jgi:Flp pilus assembly protein TadD
MGWQELKTRAREQLRSGDVGLSAHTLIEAVELAPDEPSLYVDLVQVCLLAGSPNDALKAASELRRIDPGSAKYAYLHAMAALAGDDVVGARQILEESLRKAPDSWELRQSLAQVLRLQKEEPRAQELLEEAIELAPTEEGPVNDLAVMMLEKNQGARAVRPLERLLSNKPDALGARLNLALAMVQLGKKGEARPHAEAAVKSADKSVAEQAVRLLEQLA